jgi:hypothetical protein
MRKQHDIKKAGKSSQLILKVPLFGFLRRDDSLFLSLHRSISAKTLGVFVFWCKETPFR